MIDFIMMCGLPGSLKSTCVDFLCNVYNDVEVISSDNIRIEKGYKQGEIKDVFSIAHDRILNSEHDTVIFDATNLRRKYRVALLNEVKQKYPLVNAILYVMAIPIKVCKYLNNKRSGFDKVPENVIDRMVRTFDFPVYEEGWNYICFTSLTDLGELDIIDFDFFCDENELLKENFISVSVNDMVGFEQDNPYHTLTLKEHCDRCAEYVKEHGKYLNEDDLDILVTAAKIHDIGKVLTKDYHDIRGNPTKTAHYYGHENVGAYLALTDIFEMGDVSFCSFRYRVAKLIAFHMRVSFSWRNAPYGKNTLKEKQYFDTKEYIMLELLGEADRQAH